MVVDYDMPSMDGLTGGELRAREIAIR